LGNLIDFSGVVIILKLNKAGPFIPVGPVGPGLPTLPTISLFVQQFVFIGTLNLVGAPLLPFDCIKLLNAV
jgi:hypothetical protein